tara:strand:- start:60 stop:584 length:525 start_codon:yes stop_codon:yes gene_type:complete
VVVEEQRETLLLQQDLEVQEVELVVVIEAQQEVQETHLLRIHLKVILEVLLLLPQHQEIMELAVVVEQLLQEVMEQQALEMVEQVHLIQLQEQIQHTLVVAVVVEIKLPCLWELVELVVEEQVDHLVEMMELLEQPTRVVVEEEHQVVVLLEEIIVVEQVVQVSWLRERRQDQE